MNCKNYNTAKLDENNSGYYLSIRDSDTDIFEEMYLSRKEFMILDKAIKHNRGIVNLLSDMDAIRSLFNKGLLTISNDNLNVITVVDDVVECFSEQKAKTKLSKNSPSAEENNKPSSFLKVFGKKSVCFSCF